jgi:hypothetical protein
LRFVSRLSFSGPDQCSLITWFGQLESLGSSSHYQNQTRTGADFWGTGFRIKSGFGTKILRKKKDFEGEKFENRRLTNSLIAAFRPGYPKPEPGLSSGIEI